MEPFAVEAIRTAHRCRRVAGENGTSQYSVECARYSAVGRAVRLNRSSPDGAAFIQEELGNRGGENSSEVSFRHPANSLRAPP